MQFLQYLWKNYLRITNPSCTIRAAGLSRNVKFEQGVVVEAGTYLQASHIGRHTYINKYCLIDKNTTSIGRFCSIAVQIRIFIAQQNFRAQCALLELVVFCPLVEAERCFLAADFFRFNFCYG